MKAPIVFTRQEWHVIKEGVAQHAPCGCVVQAGAISLAAYMERHKCDDYEKETHVY